MAKRRVIDENGVVVEEYDSEVDSYSYSYPDIDKPVQQRDIAVTPATVGEPLAPQDFLNRINLMKTVVKEMSEDVHFGVIPGTNNKRSLWEPGAEFLRMAFGIRWDYEVIDETVDIERGHYRYVVEAFALDSAGQRGAKWRGVADSRSSKFGRMEAGELEHNVFDRALKRAFVNLIRNVTAASGEFQTIVDDTDVDVYTQADERIDTSGGFDPSRFCPLHSNVQNRKAWVAWQKGEYGRYHRMDNGKFCNYKAILDARWAELAKSIDYTRKDLNEWLKERAMTTLGKLSDEDRAKFLTEFEAHVDSVKAGAIEAEDAPESPESDEPHTDSANTPEEPETPVSGDTHASEGGRIAYIQGVLEDAGIDEPSVSMMEFFTENPEADADDYLQEVGALI